MVPPADVRPALSRGCRASSTPAPVVPLALLGLALLGAGACVPWAGGSGSPDEPVGGEPSPAARDTAAGPPGFRDVPASVRPSEEALRAAGEAELTGLELGTMWTFEDPPRDHWEERYGFHADSSWLSHLRLASLRYGETCSASFVSPRGLVMTNHRCARECVESVSTDGTDHLEEGFYAPDREEERVCPDLSLDQLVGVEDVTDAVRGRVPEGVSARAEARARDSARRDLVEACEASGDLRCRVVPLYDGGRYRLHRYRRISPVKLVFAPELQAGYYGGGPDAVTYPRYALDVAFLRAYRPDSVRPLEPDAWLPWNPEGAGEGDLVFVAGHPGSTSRDRTVSQLQYEKAFRHPFQLDLLGQQLDYLRRIAAMGPEARRGVRGRIFRLETRVEALRGQLDGLEDPGLVGRKIRWQRDLQARIREDSALARDYGDAWSRMGEIQAELLEVMPAVRVNDPALLGEPLLGIAAELATVLRYGELPARDLPGDVTPGELRRMEERLRSQLPSSRAREGALLAIRLRLARRWLAPGAPFLEEAFAEGESPETAANRIARETGLDRVGVRRAILNAGSAVLDTTSDPLLRLAAGMVDRSRALERRRRELEAREERQAVRLAKARLSVYGTDVPPDATSTLRISEGEMRRYETDGTFAPPLTTFHGMYGRAAGFGGEMPWALPSSFRGARDRIDLTTPLDFVTTSDITGGSGGSPMIDRDGRVVGVVIGGNVEQLPNEFLFRAERARTVGVHSAGITEALRSVYGADALLEELLRGGEGGRREAAEGR